MTRPELGRLGVWGHLDSLPIDAARAFARRAEDLGYGALWVPETVGREPFTLLGLLAGIDGAPASSARASSASGAMTRRPRASRPRR